MGTLLIGEEHTNSAKKRRQHAYAKDLELQMRENEAAKLREKYQGMNVNASGWLDPEKRPDRLKPLGGAGFMSERSGRDSKVKPYHTLFLYGKVPQDGTFNQREVEPPLGLGRSPREVVDVEPIHLRTWQLHLDSSAGLMHHPLTEATAGNLKINDSVDNAYNFYATRDLDRPSAFGSIVQPLVVPYVDNRPIIMPGRYEGGSDYHPKYNPFDHDKDSGLQKDIRALLGVTQLERERTKAQLARDNDDYQRRMRRELEEERRRLMDQENEARRRMEQMRRDLENKRLEWERQRREAERAKKEKKLPKTPPVQIRPPSTNLLSDMDDTRRRLIDERRKIEELLRAQMKQPAYTEVKVVKRPPPPPTPPDSDLANRRMVEEFNYLKHKEAETRKAFRRMYPELPETNIKLEAQQRALLRQQEEALRSLDKTGLVNVRYAPPKTVPAEGYRRPGWMDRSPTPFPHRLRQRDRLYTSHSMDGDVDRIYSRAERRERAIDSLAYKSNYDADKVLDEYERLKLSSNRPASTETLTDDTWMRPTTRTAV
ncbi:mitogen-activated protein kinase kinase kinase kinase 4-like isoform X2 [Physella acuta]|uniref:mitogen-activated protein kinase kinase kinase kinase 4-like isoform X2 n=1 Tax=Physella acuta TaxID=109671 RepID=UPI0027DB5075|nr:mitogen-activated protein kinase kinase kinase kinase 4-like isoform X2 [Physella acuta]